MKLNKLGLGIVAAAITATAFSAPAEAKSNKELNTLLAIVAGGLIINEVVDRRKDRKRSPTVITEPPRRPKHDIGRRALPMPQNCQRDIRLRKGKTIRGYSQRCLQRMGYRISRDGVVRHHKWRHLSRRPNLI